MPRSLRPFGLLLACLFLPAYVLAAGAPGKPKETARYGIYFANSRIGSMLARTYDVIWEEKPAVRWDSDTNLHITALGSNVDQQIVLQQVLDKAGKPLNTRLVMNSMDRVTSIDARYEADRIVCSVEANGQKSQKIVPIPKGVSLEGDPEYTGVKGEALKVGQKSTIYFFEPMSMTIQKVQTEVVKAGTKAVNGKEVAAFLLKLTSTAAGESQSWVDERGQLLEDNNKLGLRMVREDLGAEPGAAAYEPPKDFAVATSVKTNTKIPQPRKTRLLKLKIQGVPDKALILSDPRQKVVSEDPADGALNVTYQIESRELPTITLAAAPAGAKAPGLGDAPYLGIGDPTIQKKAKELAGSETNRGLLARRVRAWVHGHMQKPSNVGAPRAASEIMASRDGVCRDYATLFAAVARATGVPTRICSGIVYFQGAFFYHAWNECQLTSGDDGWFAFDSTLDDDFVDATHVKFAQGEPTEMYATVRIVGQIKADILTFN